MLPYYKDVSHLLKLMTVFPLVQNKFLIILVPVTPKKTNQVPELINPVNFINLLKFIKTFCPLKIKILN